MEIDDPRELGFLLWQCASWMQRAELSFTPEQRALWPQFMAEGRLLREWAERHAKQDLHYTFPTGVR